MASLALLICMIGIAGLFYLDRDKTVRTSKALWLAVIWFWITGSRPVSFWFGSTPHAGSELLLDGSPTDRNVFLILLGAGLVVLCGRRNLMKSILKSNLPVIAFFAFGLVSMLWSDYPDITFKRWSKAIGDLVMVLLIATDKEPIAALQRFFSRTGFILLPLSVLCIRFFDLGRGFDPDGNPSNTGLTTNKNILGVVTFVIATAAVWRILVLLRDKSQPHRRRHLLAQATLLTFGVVLLQMAHSATSGACFVLATVLMIVTGFRGIGHRPANVHLVVLLFAVGAALVMLLGGTAVMTNAVGRDANFTGRTDVWRAVLRGVDNPLIGAGFESFWLGPRLLRVWSGLSAFMHVNEAHNGYLEEYLNLGWIGVGLIVSILATCYLRAVAAFRRDPSTGALMLAYAVAAVIYSVTEAGFRMLHPMWFCLLLAEVGAARFGLHPNRHLGGTVSMRNGRLNPLADSPWAVSTWNRP